MFFLALLVTAGALLTQSTLVTAASCWRDTSCTGPATAAFPGTWDEYSYSPATRTVKPTRILNSANSPISNYPGDTAAALKGNGSILVFDFGQLVGGIVTVTYGATGSGSLGVAFSESTHWTGEWSDSSNGAFQPDGALYATITATSEANYTMPDDKMRGGFRYLTLFTTSDNAAGAIEVDVLDINLDLSFQPAWSNLRAYQGYFSCSDETLNKIWYGGAYTLQTNAVPPNSGRAWPIVAPGWANNQNMDLGSTDPTIYVDGSKRDRTVWAGDLSVAVPSILISTGDFEGVKNTLQVLYNDQQSSGNLPFAGPGINIYNSDTYHMATLLGTYDYFLHTNDQTFLTANWDKYKLAMSFITGKIDSSGLLYVTGTDDWGRIRQGGRNTEANMMMYRTLVTGSQLATWYGDSASASIWSGLAATLKTAVNSLNWDASVGAFKDTDTDATLHPEDGNSLSILFSVADASKVSSISTQLTTNWISIGALCPELPNNLVGFIQSFEIKAHLVAQQPLRALDLIRRAWGWYLNNPNGTQSTFIEGYLSDGSFGYRATYGYDNDYSYTSHAHGWSTGPTDALTSYIVGLTVTEPAGSSWQLAPQFGDLTHAEAGFSTPLGKFSAAWTLIENGYEVSWGVPSGTNGSLVLPGQQGSVKEPSVENVRDRGVATALTEGVSFDPNEGVVRISGVTGSRTIRVTY